jgi:glyoxylase-like metal-dependent hydrolase (beta-lactamase superfamily II)
MTLSLTIDRDSGTRVDEVADGVFRISTPVPPAAMPGGFSFNPYLLLDDQPLLFHTGPRRTFPLVARAIAAVMPIERLRWVAFSHVEADECGALNQLLAAAPHALPLCGELAAMVHDRYRPPCPTCPPFPQRPGCPRCPTRQHHRRRARPTGPGPKVRAATTSTIRSRS